MAKEIKLDAQTRSEKNEDKAKKNRAEGYVPAVIYGPGIDNVNIKIKQNEFNRVFRLAGESNLIDLVIDGQKSIKVIIKAVQKDSVKGNVIHIDFYQINMNKPITTEIPFNFIGEAPVVKTLGGTIIKGVDSVEVECLPGDLVDHIDIDLSKLTTFADLIHLNDIIMPNGMTLVSQTNEVVVSVAEVTEEKAVVQQVAEIAPEVKGKEATVVASAGDKGKKNEKENKK
ncbi:MAG: 50S ribosomal protein L25 [bacterium]|nr:50S ribosomal protein L25 [bacterium]